MRRVSLARRASEGLPFPSLARRANDAHATRSPRMLRCATMAETGAAVRASSSCPPRPATGSPNGGEAMPKARIVVVEDEPAIRRGVSDALRLSGYEVTEAADGVHGLREGSAA